jgi:CheY-like chemotaxis protein
MILLVEDNAQITAVYLEALRGAGYTVDAVETGAASIEAAGAKTYDLILMDLSLPDMPGTDAVAVIRKNNPAIPIIAVSGAQPLIDPAKLHAANFVDMIHKPSRLSAFIEIVGRYVKPSLLSR